jgi:hypothetical protein
VPSVRSLDSSWIDPVSEALGVDLDHLRAAERITERRLKDAREALRQSLEQRLGEEIDDNLDLLVQGSMARREMSGESDFDYLIVAYGMVVDPDLIQEYRAAADDARQAIKAPEPGATNLFGDLVSGTDLVHRIGLEQDTNRSLTNRVLVLLESESLLYPDKHRQLVEVLLRRYLIDYLSERSGGPRMKRGVPWFLVNDVVRYWRTVAVDYQAKRWVELKGQKWGTRYIKLRSSRKWTFAGTMVSLYMPRILRVDVTPELMLEQFTKPPLARLAQLHEYLPTGDARDALKSILVIADQFVGRFGSRPFREALNEVTHPTEADTGSIFDEAKILTRDLQRNLENLFFSEDRLINRPQDAGAEDPRLTLGALSRHYLVF